MKKIVILLALVTCPLFGGAFAKFGEEVKKNATPKFVIDNKANASIEVQEKFWNAQSRQDKYNYLASIAPKSRQEVTLKNNGGLVLFPKGPACSHMSAGENSEVCNSNKNSPIQVQRGKTLEITQFGQGPDSIKWHWK